MTKKSQGTFKKSCRNIRTKKSCSTKKSRCTWRKRTGCIKRRKYVKKSVKKSSRNRKYKLNGNTRKIMWIRHCYSCSNKFKTWKTSEPLCTEEGIEQSLMFGYKLPTLFGYRNTKIDENTEEQLIDYPDFAKEVGQTIYCSFLPRAIETAFLIALGINFNFSKKFIKNIQIVSYVSETKQLTDTVKKIIKGISNRFKNLLKKNKDKDLVTSQSVTSIASSSLFLKEIIDRLSNITFSKDRFFSKERKYKQESTESDSNEEIPRVTSGKRITSGKRVTSGKRIKSKRHKKTETESLNTFFPEIIFSDAECNKLNKIKNPLNVTCNSCKSTCSSNSSDYKNFHQQILPKLSDDKIHLIVSHGGYIKDNIFPKDRKFNNLEAGIVTYSLLPHNTSFLPVSKNKLTTNKDFSWYSDNYYPFIETKKEVISKLGDYAHCKYKTTSSFK